MKGRRSRRGRSSAYPSGVPRHRFQSFPSSSKDNKKRSLSTSSFPSLSSSRKTCRRPDGTGQSLQALEDLHIESKRNLIRYSCSSSGTDSSSSYEEVDGAVSTSEDAIYGEKREPNFNFDLVKSLLRQGYNHSNNTKSDLEEKNFEMDVATDNTEEEKIDTTYQDGSARVDAEASVTADAVADGMEINEVKGPTFRDLGGMGALLENLIMEIIVPLCHPHFHRWFGVRPESGILLHGPPGCGKTNLARAIANETGLPFYKISATEVVSGVSGASEANIRELFSKAYRTAPSIVFIDEIDAIASKRENMQREMECRIVTQLLTCMDESHRLVQPNDKDSRLDSSEVKPPGHVLVIGATNRPDAVDRALRRPGRFGREILLGVPDENARHEILSVVTRNMRLDGSVNLLKIARVTPGFVGADLAAVADKAGNLALTRLINQSKREGKDVAQACQWWKQLTLPKDLEKQTITMADFEEAAKTVQPSSRREGFSAIPDVEWEDVGGLDSLRNEFERYIVRPIKFPEEYAEFGVDLDTGILLYGPPGCGKTLIAMAVANKAGANFIHIKGPELLDKYVGVSEGRVRSLFDRARLCSPCILFFDEVDALTTERGKDGGSAGERLLNQLLIELDGADRRRGVYVIGATNRPEVMDRAVLRPGRFGKHLHVPLPSPDERVPILKALTRAKPIDASVDLSAIGRMEACENFSGADLYALVNEASLLALEDKSASEGIVKKTIRTLHFEEALGKISRSVSDQQKQFYKAWSWSYRTG